MSITFWLENGTEDEELNMCNTNACGLLRLLDRDKDAANHCGSWTPETQSKIFERISKIASAEFEKETVVNGRIVEIGRDPAYVSGRLGRMKALLKRGIETQTTLHFG